MVDIFPGNKQALCHSPYLPVLLIFTAYNTIRVTKKLLVFEAQVRSVLLQFAPDRGKY